LSPGQCVVSNRNRNRNRYQDWDRRQSGLASIGTGFGWDWLRLGLASAGTGFSWDWRQSGLVSIGSGFGTGPSCRMTRVSPPSEVFAQQPFAAWRGSA
jgi:hypothetical protein